MPRRQLRIIGGTVPAPTTTASNSARSRWVCSMSPRPADPEAGAAGGRDPPVEGLRDPPEHETAIGGPRRGEQRAVERREHRIGLPPGEQAPPDLVAHRVVRRRHCRALCGRGTPAATRRAETTTGACAARRQRPGGAVARCAAHCLRRRARNRADHPPLHAERPLQQAVVLAREVARAVPRSPPQAGAARHRTRPEAPPPPVPAANAAAELCFSASSPAARGRSSAASAAFSRASVSASAVAASISSGVIEISPSPASAASAATPAPRARARHARPSASAIASVSIGRNAALAVAAAEQPVGRVDRVEHRLQQLAERHRLERPAPPARPWPAAPSAAGRIVAGQRASAHLQIRLQRAGGLDRLQDADQVARPDAERVQAGHQVAQRDAAGQDAQLLVAAVVAPARWCAARRRWCRCDSGPGWLTSGVSVTRIVRLPWAIGDRADAHVGAHHDGAAGFVDRPRSRGCRARRAGPRRGRASSTTSRPTRSSATVRGSSARAVPAPSAWLIAAAMRSRGGQVRVAQRRGAPRWCAPSE